MHTPDSFLQLISNQPADPTKKPTPGSRNLTTPQPVRLLQMDIAARDPHAITGWIFGTFMYTNTLGQTVSGLVILRLQ